MKILSVLFNIFAIFYNEILTDSKLLDKNIINTVFIKIISGKSC